MLQRFVPPLLLLSAVLVSGVIFQISDVPPDQAVLPLAEILLFVFAILMGRPRRRQCV